MHDNQELLERIKMKDGCFPLFKDRSTVLIYTPEKTIYTSPTEYLNMVCAYLKMETSGLDFYMGYSDTGEVNLTPIVTSG